MLPPDSGDGILHYHTSFLLQGKPMNPMRKPALDNLTVMIDEINLLKEKLTKKEKQLDMVREENELLKKKVKKATVKYASFSSYGGGIHSKETPDDQTTFGYLHLFRPPPI
uniref:Uncharacterized protein n=1 Tax=Nelumbo nucifera TaxID=4432 RepID=A0A822XL83_NELNU|nr:TPA_asm: hypothetical protein HUJ06_019761 [Nelumbo nucifera]